MWKSRDLILGRIAAFLAVFQVLVVIGSWLITASRPESSMRSLLSSEGIRWFLGHFANHLSSPFLVWIILISIAFGTVVDSGMLQICTKKVRLDYRKRLALRMTLLELMIFVAIMLLLSISPHAVLLSATGHLIPGSFSRCLIPVLAFIITVCTLSYGMMSGRYKTLASVYRALYIGIEWSAPFYVIYVMGASVYWSLFFVFG